MNNLNTFVEDGIYQLKTVKDSIFLCEACSQPIIGKLVEYKKQKKEWIKTGTCYFLNNYEYGDIKQLFVTRENYDMLGLLNKNYLISEDRNKLIDV